METSEQTESASTWLPHTTSSSVSGGGIVFDWYPWALLHIGVAITAGLILNTVIIVAFLKSTLLRNERPAYQLIFNLAVSDFLSALFAPPFAVFYYADEGQQFAQTTKYPCVIALAASIVAFDASVAAILLMTGERLIAVLAPMYHLRVVTKRHCKFAILAAWFLVLAKSGILIFWNDLSLGDSCVGYNVMPPTYFSYFFTPIQYGSLIAIALLNSIMAVGAWISRSKLQGVTPNNKQRSNQKIVKMVLILVFTLYLCWVPFGVAALAVQYTIRSMYIRPPRWLLILHDVTRGVICYSLILDPINYIWQNTKCRLAVRALFKA